MTMHLEGPWLSTVGKRKGKQKFRNSDEARKARELKEEWEKNQSRWASLNPNFSKGLKKTKVTLSNSLPSMRPPPGRESQTIPSLDTGVKGAVTIKQSQQYTGTKILGIGTMHKSNAVPIFSDEEAQDISKMRR